MLVIEHTSGAIGSMLPDPYGELDLAALRACCYEVFAALRENDPAISEVFLPFQEAALYLQTDGRCTLVLLTVPEIEPTALRLAGNLFLRQLNATHLAELAAQAQASPPEATTVSVAASTFSPVLQRPKPPSASRRRLPSASEALFGARPTTLSANGNDNSAGNRLTSLSAASPKGAGSVPSGQLTSVPDDPRPPGTADRRSWASFLRPIGSHKPPPPSKTRPPLPLA